MKSLLLVGLVVAGCHDEGYLQYSWDDRRVLCSNTVDDLTHDGPWDLIDSELELASNRTSVALLHAHEPGRTVSLQAVERLLDLADEYGLDYLTYRELDPDNQHRSGIALAFDDQYIDAWYELRGLLAAHRARVTFFVTRFYSRTDEERAKLAELAAEGHDVEAHSVDHLNALDYVHDHGLDAYLTDEVLPSIQILRDAGYQPTSYAFPFGASDEAIDRAVLEHVERVRVSPAACLD
ncbi:MAG: Polysaccharide deacetylase [Deltaproteobacteria bacterium]|nr:Polysaccharide deacetylase [Deltaproteobacteria bacterium]